MKRIVGIFENRRLRKLENPEKAIFTGGLVPDWINGERILIPVNGTWFDEEKVFSTLYLKP